MAGFKYDTFQDYLNSKEDKQYPHGILEFRNTDENSVLYDTIDTIGKAEYQNWVKNRLGENLSIWAVKNKNGEILRVGDETDWFNKAQIQSLEIITSSKVGMKLEKDLDLLFVRFMRHIYPNPLPIDCVHYPTKKFKTEDSFDVVDGELIYLVYPDMSSGSDSFNSKLEYKKTKVFKHKENADKYYGMNRKQFSKQDILDSIDGDVSHENSRGIIVINKHKLGL